MNNSNRKKVISLKDLVQEKNIYLSKDGIKKSPKGNLVSFDDVITVDDAFQIISTKGTDQDKLELLVDLALKRKLLKNRKSK